MTLDAADRARVGEVADFVRTHDTASVVAELLPDLSLPDRKAIGSHCRFTHAAVLIFPEAIGGGLRLDLENRGLLTGRITPSVVVRERLSRRYARPLEALDVGILRAVVGSRGGEVEIFALAVPPGSDLEEIAADERRNGFEAHIALEVESADTVVLSGLRAVLVDRGGMRADGGGYNQYEDVTVCYFRTAGGRRLELIIKGHHPGMLGSRLGETDRPAETLLRSMTGAWTTQAIAVAAQLRIADHLAGGALGAGRLAAATGTDEDSLRRLLRFLAGLGIVRSAGDAFELTEVGRLLRTDLEESLHPLAVLYGGPFYESFGRLMHSVRTGGQAFEELFGSNHFDYFAERPELADLFDRAMAGSTAMFGRLPELVDFSGARVVVDVAGGNGQLLGRILAAEPHLRGVLLERPHTLEAARSVLTKAGCAGRCEFVAGDFTSAVPAGGDVYVLSRVLHDWDDDRCRTILRRCAEAMPGHAELVVIERLLPDDDTPSLALPWDIHMMCNVGGRERTAADYRRLLSEAGFQVVGRAELPLEVAVLRARR